MRTSRLLRSFPARLAACLAAFTLLVGQPGGLVHGWSHDLAEAHPAHAHTDGVAHGAGGHEDRRHAPSHDGPDAAWALCDLCALYSALVHVTGTAFPRSLLLPTNGTAHFVPDPPARRGQFPAHYAARAPPSLLS